MAHRVIDRRIGSKARNENPTGLDRREEKISEYFLPERGQLKVRRFELLAILTMIHKGERNMKWYRRLWRNLKRAVGSEPTEANPQPESGVTVLGKQVGEPTPAEIERQRARLSEEA